MATTWNYASEPLRNPRQSLINVKANYERMCCYADMFKALLCLYLRLSVAECRVFLCLPPALIGPFPPFHPEQRIFPLPALYHMCSVGLYPVHMLCVNHYGPRNYFHSDGRQDCSDRRYLLTSHLAAAAFLL